MTDREALLRAILAHPDEDTPRLAFADLLDEQGEPERAGFIRAQVWPWRNPSCGSCSGPEWAAGKPCAECRIREEMRGQAAMDLFGLGRWHQYAGPVCEVVPAGAAWDDHIQFARGFVEEIRCPLASFLKHAKAVFSAHPVTEVRLTDIRPTAIINDPDYWTYFIGTIDTGYHIPQDIYYRLRGPWGHSQESALNALSTACVEWGRSLAGLPPLPARV